MHQLFIHLLEAQGVELITSQNHSRKRRYPHFVTSRNAYHLNSDLRNLTFLRISLLLQYALAFISSAVILFNFNCDRSPTVDIVSTLSFMQYSVSDLFVNGGRLKSFASKNTISDQMHGCSLDSTERIGHGGTTWNPSVEIA